MTHDLQLWRIPKPVPTPCPHCLFWARRGLGKCWRWEEASRKELRKVLTRAEAVARVSSGKNVFASTATGSAATGDLAKSLEEDVARLDAALEAVEASVKQTNSKSLASALDVADQVKTDTAGLIHFQAARSEC